MRRVLLIGVGVAALLAFALTYSVWRESTEPVAGTPGPLATGRMQLHAQLEEAKKIEGDAERQAWNSPAQLRALIQGHEQRIDQLKDDKEASEIVGYDREAVDRLEKRIAQIAEEEAAKAEAAKQAAEAKRESAQP